MMTTAAAGEGKRLLEARPLTQPSHLQEIWLEAPALTLFKEHITQFQKGLVGSFRRLTGTHMGLVLLGRAAAGGFAEQIAETQITEDRAGIVFGAAVAVAA